MIMTDADYREEKRRVDLILGAFNEAEAHDIYEAIDFILRNRINLGLIQTSNKN